MQKLDFSENIYSLKELLKSDEIIAFINKIPNGGKIDTYPLTPLLIESKSNYDKIEDEGCKEILKTIDGEIIYSQQNISLLINTSTAITLQGQSKAALFTQLQILEFINFHTTLINSSKLSKIILLKNNTFSNIEDNDTVVFRIMSVEELEITRYTKILTLLNDLIEIIQKVNEDENFHPTITLLDSGSDTNLGIKTTVETAKSLFQIFKEVWDWVLNRKFYTNKLRNTGLLDNLNVMVSIKEALDKGAIDEQTAKIYRETVIRRTEDLLELNVIPKSLVELNDSETNKKLLGEYQEIKLLESKNNN